MNHIKKIVTLAVKIYIQFIYKPQITQRTRTIFYKAGMAMRGLLFRHF